MPDEAFVIKDDHGIQFKPISLSQSAGGIPPMKPGEIREGQVLVNKEYSHPDSLKIQFWDDVDVLGHDMVSGAYKIYCDWSGIMSNTLNIEVIKPSGSEFEAMKLFKSGFKSVKLDDKKNERIEKQINRLDSLVELFPESRFAPQALYRMTSKAHYHNNGIDVANSKKMLEKYLDREPYIYHGSAFDFLETAYDKMDSIDTAIQYISKIKEKSKSQKIKEMADKKLEQIYKKKQNKNK